jgi:hypothetical protein
MSLLSLRLSRAVERGRSQASPPPSRQQILVSLLTKRAVASRMGATELEAQLREQIRWSMPTFDRMVFDDELTSEAA